MTKTNMETAQTVALATRDAYSRNRYTDAGWVQIAKRLIEAGFTPAQIDLILRSKTMRWAADNANRTHSATAADFARYMTATYGGLNTPKFVASMPELLTADVTTKPIADLARNCRPSDTAALIQFALLLRAEQGQTTNFGRMATDILTLIEKR